MEPTEALNACENALRNIIKTLMGDKWLEALNSDQRQAISKSRDNELAARDGVRVSDDLLAFTYTGHLTKVIETNWQLFSPVFKNRPRTIVSFEALNSYRRTVAHNRQLRPFERDLLSGISGQIRNQIALYLSEGSLPRRFYPVIESAVDSFGNRPAWPHAVMGMDEPERIHVQVGDQITFDCAATDPRGLELHWALRLGEMYYGSYLIPYGQLTGDRVTMSITIGVEHVGYLGVKIEVRNTEPYRQYDPHDDARGFWYIVDPPAIPISRSRAT